VQISKVPPPIGFTHIAFIWVQGAFEEVRGNYL